MFDDAFLRALIAGIGLALIAGPLGCFVIWQRMAYLGDTMAHSALLGVALSYFFEVNLMIGVFVVSIAVSLFLLALERGGALASDTILGLLSHSTLAVGLVMVAAMTWLDIDLETLLFGDILSVTGLDIAVIYSGGAVILGLVVWLWRPLLATTANAELAGAEGLHPALARFVFTLLMAGIIAMAMKVVGILLITALLIIPPATARRFAATPERMAAIASGLGVLAVTGGLHGARALGSPSGPSIVVAALGLFVLSLLASILRRK